MYRTVNYSACLEAMVLDQMTFLMDRAADFPLHVFWTYPNCLDSFSCIYDLQIKQKTHS